MTISWSLQPPQRELTNGTAIEGFQYQFNSSLTTLKLQLGEDMNEPIIAKDLYTSNIRQSGESSHSGQSARQNRR